MDARSAAPFVSVAPKASHTLSADGPVLMLGGDFKPGTEYTVTIRKGLTAADGAELAEDHTEAIRIPDMEPSVSFEGSGMFLPRHKGAGLALTAVNADRISVRVDRVYPNNIFSMLHEYGWRVFEDNWDYSGVPYAFGGRIHEETIPVRGTPNQPVTLPLQLRDLVDSGERGLFKVSAAMPGKNGVKRWLMLTDIGLVAKRDENKFTVWAVSNTTLQPLSGVRLTLVSDKNQTLSRSSTNAAGVGLLRIPADHSDGSPFMILAEHRSGDFTFLLPSRFSADTTGLDVSGVEASPAGLRAYIYGERDLYRPGETVKAMAVVRKDSLAAPPSIPLTLTQRDPKGRDIRTIRLKTDADGTAAFELPVPDYALTGGHSLTLKAGDTTIGTYDFKVEEFIPDRIKVEVVTEKQQFLPGQTVKAEIKSSYLFGPPASSLPVTVRAQLRTAPFTAKGYEDYAFGDPDRSFEPQEIFSEDGTLSEAGTAKFDIPLPGGLTPPAALEAMLYGRVSETGGRGVTARKRVTIHPYEYYIGIKKLNKNGFESEQPITFDFICLDPQGKEATHGPLTAKLYRDRYRTVVRKAPSGGFRYESVNDPQLLTETSVPAGSGAGSVTFTPALRQLPRGHRLAQDRRGSPDHLLQRRLGLLPVGAGKPGARGARHGQGAVPARRNRHHSGARALPRQAARGC
ncbi:MG2 domain-containing protein [Salidesulfovibrio brasiliensis]|uniref:MG2 domain-containing protein n=1 Tax=Salidesulfovibrio brasiliensis TaxID=221711 RepID=UPI0006D0547B|nr:MG2 domain-containing protein [Salidesulfovibrio brasiliensis]